MSVALLQISENEESYRPASYPHLYTNPYEGIIRYKLIIILDVVLWCSNVLQCHHYFTFHKWEVSYGCEM